MCVGLLLGFVDQWNACFEHKTAETGAFCGRVTFCWLIHLALRA